MILPPPIACRDEYRAWHRNVSFWRPYADHILQKHGLQGETWHCADVDHSNIVFVGDRHVLKLYSPQFDGLPSHALESAALNCLAGAPVPRIMARGLLCPNWPYLILCRIPGQELARGWKSLPRQQQFALSCQIGQAVSEFHQTRPSQELVRTYQQLTAGGFRGFLLRQLTTLPVNFPFQDELEDTIERASEDTILHGDLEDNHVFLHHGRVSGIIDFGDVKIGDPIYDFVTLRVWWFRRHNDLWRAFLEGYGYQAAEEDESKLAAFACLHEWRNHTRINRLMLASQAKSLAELGRYIWHGEH